MRYDHLRKLGIIESTVDGLPIQTYDILNVTWKDFKITQGTVDHIISKAETEKPWLIAFKYYGSEFFEDVLFLINKVRNPLQDLPPAKFLTIPALSDIQSFVNTIKQ